MGEGRMAGAYIALAVLGCLPASPAAAEADPGTYIAAGLFYASPDSARRASSGEGVSYGYAASASRTGATEVRVFADTLETDVAGWTDFYQYGAGIDFLRYFGNPAAGHLYGLVGGGAVSNDVDPDSEDGISGYANLGIGWRSAPWRKWGLRHRLELRGVYDSFQSGQVDVIAGLALEIGQERTVTVERIVERVVEREVIREVPVAAVVVDRDGDGVPDDSDSCPDTVPGARVEADGCVRQAQVVVLPNIEFEFARAELTDSGRAELGKVLRFLQDQPEIRLEVWGHTDNKGGDVYNLRLSQDRAASVVDFLTGGGVDAARLASAGFGKTRPMASNDTEEGQARNRRVELHIRTGNRVVGSR